MNSLLLLALLGCRSDTNLTPTSDSAPSESGVVDTDTEDSDTEDSDTEDSDTEDSDTEDSDTEPPPVDMDADGHTEDVDCNDGDATVFPGASEVCDGVDSDCIPSNEDTACGCTTATFEARTYAFCPVHLDWDGGRATCQLLGLDLVFIDSEAENSFVSGTGASVHPGLRWWMGLTDVAVEGSFTSVGGASPTYTAWCPGEPNNGHGGECSAQSAENCAVLDWCAAGGWNDLPCDCSAETIGFVCEA